jgi:hypothetical protein
MLRRELVAIVAVALAACAAGMAAGSGHVLLGTPAILHWLRYVPVLALALVLPAGYAALTLVAAAARRALPAGALTAVVVGAAAMGSTGLAAAAIRNPPGDPGLSCSRTLPFDQSDTVAVATGNTFVTGYVGFAIFSSTGTRVLWLRPRVARVPFRRMPPGILGETARHRELMRIVHGARPPPAVRWVMTDAPARALAPDLHPYGRCVWDGSTPLRLYRAG